MTSELGYRVCPSCREEYTLAMSRCADCSVDLVSPDLLPPDDDGAVADFPPASELTCIRVAPIAWIRALSEGLEEAEVPHRVEPASPTDAPEGQRAETFGDVDLFGLYVLHDDAASARELDRTFASRVLPEEAPDLDHEETDECPACGTELAADATECPDCGLTFG